LTRKFARTRAPLENRDNTYSIDPAVEPTLEHAVGIDQDGTDFSYFAEVQLGSNKKTLYMLTDTGASTSWAMSSDCTSAPCGLHNSFGSSDSSSLKLTKNQFSIGYSTGSVKGVVASDTVSVGDLTMPFQFGLASEITDEFMHFPFDGILGLARNDGRTKTFLNTIKDAKLLQANLFAFYLGRASDGPNVGELSFGAVNTDKFEGDITYTDLTDKDGNWIIPMDALSYNGNDAVGSLPAYMDTGTTYMFGPPDTVRKFHDAIPGAETSDNVTYTVPCNVAHEPVAQFSGVGFTISKDDWLSPPNNGICTSNIYGIEVLSGSWLIGGTFLKNVYSVFDNDHARIGFAQKVVPEVNAAGVPTKTSKSGSNSPITSGIGSPTSAASIGSTGQETELPKGDARALSQRGSAAYVSVVFIATSLVALIA
jgi:hypothetical protein